MFLYTNAHENDGEVVLLFPPGLLSGRGGVARHGHLATVSVLNVFVNLWGKKFKNILQKQYFFCF